MAYPLWHSIQLEGLPFSWYVCHQQVPCACHASYYVGDALHTLHCHAGGNAYNQLAVLSTYSEDDLAAVFHYFRSLAVAKPFTIARENLVLLLEQIRVKYTKLPQPSQPKRQDQKGPAQKGPGQKGPAQNGAAQNGPA